MVSGLSILQLVGLALLAGLGLTASTAIKLILEKEYTSWSSALARLLTRLAGVLCRRRRGQWWADVLYEQKVKNESGLFQAGSCLASAPALALSDGFAAIGARVRHLRSDELFEWQRRRRVLETERQALRKAISEAELRSDELRAEVRLSGTLSTEIRRQGVDV